MQDDIEGGRQREVVGELRGIGRIPHPINSEEGLIDAGQVVIVRGGVRGGGRRVRVNVSVIHLLLLVLCVERNDSPSPLPLSPLPLL